MFTKVHHVTYIVEDAKEMANYLEQNFGFLQRDRIKDAKPSFPTF